MKKILITSILFAMGWSSLSAQGRLYVQPVNGEQIEFVLANKPEITFAEGTMTITVAGAPFPFPFQLTNVQNLSFIKNQPSNIAMAVEDNGIHLFPNPVKDELTLDIKNLTPNTIYRLFNVSGTLVETGRALSHRTMINVQHYPQGIYVLSVEQDGRQVQSFRIVKQ